ncbi:MAG: hypothetical protein V2G33_06900 [bacterium JZ-2024 1]
MENKKAIPQEERHIIILRIKGERDSKGKNSQKKRRMMKNGDYGD